MKPGPRTRSGLTLEVAPEAKWTTQLIHYRIGK
jgi:hypothetical protein